MKRHLFSVLLLLALLTSLTGCSVVGSRISHALGDEEYHIMNEEIVTGRVENIEIDWSTGNVKLTRWDGDSVIIREKSDTTLTSRTRMRVRLSDGNLTIEETARGVWLMPLLFNKDLEVLVPSHMDIRAIDIDGASGRIETSGFSPRTLSVQSTSGSIAVSDMGTVGRASIKSTSGSIKADLLAAVEFKAESTSGSVKATIEKEGGKIEARSTSGSVRLSTGNSESIKAQSTSGSLEIGISGKCAKVDASSTSGSVNLTLGEAIRGFQMRATSTSGRVYCDFPSRVIGDSYTYGDGSTAIRVTTQSGKIHAHKA